MKRITAVLFLFILFTQLNAQSFQPNKGCLSTLNNQFHSDYNALVADIISHFGDSTHPIIIFTGDCLVFRYRGTRQSGLVIPPEYHQLKAISHLPLGIFTMVSTWQEGKLTSNNIHRLKEYDSLINVIYSEIDNYSYNSALLKVQQQILKHSQNYIQFLLAENKYEEKTRNEFSRKIEQYILDDVDESAKLELTGLHNQTQIWLKQIPIEKRQQLYVVIGSSHQARYRELSVQYFDRILNEQSDGSALSENRLVFAESVFLESGCLSVLARHIIDQEVGLQFFGDRYRMQRDLLSDAATKYINRLFASPPKLRTFPKY